jgi:CxxC motif-containing protein
MKEHELVCICCPIGCDLHINKTAEGYAVTGNKCPRGKKYAIDELTAPTRIVTSTVKVTGGLYPVISVKTASPIPKDKIFVVMEVLTDISVKAPVKVGDVIVQNVAGTGVNIVATKNA